MGERKDVCRREGSTGMRFVAMISKEPRSPNLPCEPFASSDDYYIDSLSTVPPNRKGKGKEKKEREKES